MHVWNSITRWNEHRRSLAGRSVGFVATMGALHRGHASLIARCRDENDVAAASIFVNPTQFNDPADLRRYPRTLEADLALLESLGTDDVLVPTADQMYPCGYRLRIEPVAPSALMEAAHRPGFFEGVMTVVMKLLEIVRPDRAYFGEKDYQQLRTIQELVEEFFLTCAIVPCATVREPSGLAGSSRNALLSPEGRAHAAWIFRALGDAADCAEARRILEARGFAVEYVEEHWGRRFAAARLEGVRLIDNIPVSKP